MRIFFSFPITAFLFTTNEPQSYMYLVVETTLYILTLDRKTDLTPNALNYHWGMAVPSEIKPFVLAIPIIFTLITIIKTVMSSNMTKKEKALSYIIAAFSLVVSVAIVNWNFDI